MSSSDPSRPTLEVDDSMDAKTQIATRMLRSLLEDHLLQIALDHHDGARQKRRALSRIAEGTVVDDTEEADATMEDGEVKETPLATTSGLQARATHSASTTPAPSSSKGPTGPTASTSSAALYASNPLLECLACRRHVSSNRYAPHLAKCLGLGAVGTNGPSGKSHPNNNSSHGLKRKATVSAAMASSSMSGGGKQRGRPPKHRDVGNGSARSNTGTPVPGP